MSRILPETSLPRRRFVQGVAALGATAAVGWPSRSAFARSQASNPAVLSGTHFDLRLDRMTVNKTGTPSWANAINGGVPGPVLRWRQGDIVTLNVTNNLPEVTGVHWHGIILPNNMDGVPGLEFPGIQPGETFTYRFPVVQSGTYWYHSHMGYQEQKGALGALVIEPEGEPLIQADREHVILLEDWMDGDPYVVQNDLKHMSSFWNYNRRTLGTFVDDARQSGLGPTIKERLRWADMRMDPTGLAQPTGAFYTYLMNGQPPKANWTALFRPGERVRLRIINGSAITYYDVRIPGLTMEVVQVHGNDVVPVPVDELRIGVAEVYDVIVRPTENRAYTIFAQDFERSGYARGTLAPRAGMVAAIPPMDAPALRSMTDMGMPKMMPDQVDASTPERTRIDAIMGKMDGKPDAQQKARLAAYQPMAMRPMGGPKLHPGVENIYVAKMPDDRLALPGDGLNYLAGKRRILTYGDLRSVNPGLDKRPPTREIVLNLTGNMQRFIWGFNGKKFSEVGPIDVKLGERFRIRYINNTMMSHPIHLHGMWQELENGGGEHRPYLHTVNVKPGENISVLVTPLATGQWPLHCHVLYHFEAGMFRTLRVLPA
ncbi:copper resistance system multicopper oxidase [Lichenicoccus sp.]|uniref:copper resistance system multicopper oxidase n=1 Tax=Lichenicoccus sp. TaxID=2781899 RepID=UPI003D0B1437